MDQVKTSGRQFLKNLKWFDLLKQNNIWNNSEYGIILD